MSVMVRIIDCTYGRPASSVSVRLEREVDGIWVEQERDLTNDKGCIARLGEDRLAPGIYRLELNLDSYFFSLGITPFCPAVSMQFRMADPTQPHDISLLVSPSSFFAYRVQ